MNKYLFFGFIFLFYACDDGELQIETLDFDAATIQNCEVIEAGSANVLFKLNTTEALILELSAAVLKNEISDGPVAHLVTASGATKVTYRTFSDNISNSYFCSDVPLTSPTVVEEIIAEAGSVFITTTAKADSLTYEHEIQLSGISLITSKDTRITDLSINNFGTVITSLPE